MKTQKIYLFSLVFVLCLCIKGQTVFAEEALQVEDNWLTQEVARQVDKSDVNTLTQEDFEKIKSIIINNTKTINTIPKEIKYLKNLSYLDLSFQDISNLPDEIFTISKLDTLCLDNNKIKCLPKGIKNFKNLTCLRLESNQLSTLPVEFWELTNLQYLSLDRNNLSKLSEKISNFNKLKTFTIDLNELMTIPESIVNLKSLTYLDFSMNNLTKLPDQIGNLCNLIHLEVRSNNLVNLPLSIENLKNLEWISFADNKLTEIPMFIKNLPNLSYISFSGNSISEIPFIYSDNDCYMGFSNQRINLPTKKLIANSTYETKIFVSVPNAEIEIYNLNYGTYSNTTNTILWETDKNRLLTYIFKCTLNNNNFTFSGTVYQPIEIIDAEETTDNKIFFTDDYSAITFTKNESIRIPINISTIKDYYALDGSVKYDKTKLEFLGYSVKNNYKDCYADSSGTHTLRFIIASKGRDNPIKTSDDPIIYLNFKCIGSGDAEIEITSASLANLNEEVDIKKELLDKATIHITESGSPSTNDINKDGKFSLIDLAIDAYYYGISADQTDKTKYDADIVPDGVIDDLDLMEITKNIIANKK